MKIEYSFLGRLLLLALLLSECGLLVQGKAKKGGSKGKSKTKGKGSHRKHTEEVKTSKRNPTPFRQYSSHPPPHKWEGRLPPPNKWEEQHPHPPPHKLEGHPQSQLWLPQEYQGVCLICQLIEAFTERVLDRLLIRVIESMINAFVDLLPDREESDNAHYQTLHPPETPRGNSNSALFDVSLGHSSDVTMGNGRLPEVSLDNSVDVSLGGAGTKGTPRPWDLPEKDSGYGIPGVLSGGGASYGQHAAKVHPIVVMDKVPGYSHINSIDLSGDGASSKDPYREYQNKARDPGYPEHAYSPRDPYQDLKNKLHRPDPSHAFDLKIPELAPYPEISPRDGLPYQERNPEKEEDPPIWLHYQSLHPYPNQRHYDSREQKKHSQSHSHPNAQSHTHSVTHGKDGQTETHTIDLDTSNYYLTIQGPEYNPDFLYNGARKRKKRN